MTHKINNQDVNVWSKEYEGEKFHALFCDAPYHLTTITKRLGKEGSAPAKFGTDGAFGRVAKGFMGQEWDGGDVAFRPETWAGFLPHLHPGAFGMSFGGSRTAHRIACAIEDAGFILHPLIGWVYGCLSEDSEVLTESGFKPFHRTTKYDRILTYDNQTDIFKWEIPERWQEFSVYKDTAYRIQSNTTDQLVSRNHRCLVEREGKLVFIQANKLSEMEFMPVLSSNFLGVQEGFWGLLFKAMQWANSWKRVGNIRTSSPKSLERGVRKSLSAKNDGGNQPIMEGGTYLQKAKRAISKSIYKICEMPRRGFEYGKERWICNGTSSNSGSNTRQTAYTNRGSASYRPQCGAQPLDKSNAVSEQQGTQAVRTRSGYRTTLATVTKTEYTGRIWCPTVSTGAFVARRNEKVFITGNSGFPKATRVKGNETFDGYRYGLQALKPAMEPIIVFQKPYDSEVGNSVANITLTGAGALNIDGGRISLQQGETYNINRFDDGMKPFGNGAGHAYTPTKIKTGSGKGKIGNDYGWTTTERNGEDWEGSELGRWPANFIIEKTLVKVYVLRYNIPDAVKTTIQEYYNDYTMPNVPKKFSNLSLQSKEGKGGILQSGLLCQMDEYELGREVSSQIQQTPHTANQGEDEQEQEAGGKVWGEQSDLEGRKVPFKGLCVDVNNSSSKRGTGDVQGNDGITSKTVSTRASGSDGEETRQTTFEAGGGTPFEWNKERQSPRESGNKRPKQSSNGILQSGKRESELKAGDRETFRVAELDIPIGWLKYFDFHGEFVNIGTSESLDQQSGHLKSGKMSPTVSRRSTNGSPNGIYGKFDVNNPLQETYGDSGGASRFFFNVQTSFDEADPFVYEKKVSQKERNAGLDDLPSQMMGMSGGAQSHGEGYDKGQGIGLNRVTEKKNSHPTLKSLSLTKYLATLLLPPIEYAPRRLLVPFSGVSSEMIGSLLAGWEYVEGIEMGKEYCEIGEKRLQYWVKH